MSAKEMFDFMKGGKEFTEHSVLLVNPDYLKELILQACKEQRLICRKAYTDGGFAKDIENAPTPEL